MPLPAPIPMVGISSCSDITFAIFPGTASNSNIKHPASCIANASSKIFIAAAAVFPCNLNPPNIAIVCGVKPMCDAVGIPESTNAFKICACPFPP